MFWGKSSDARLVQFAMHSVNSATTSGPESRRGNVRKRHEYWDVQPVRIFFSIFKTPSNLFKVDETAKRIPTRGMQFS